MSKDSGGRRHGSHLLPDAEWDVSILNHVHDLALHCEDEKHNPITKQYGPENGDIKYRKEGHQKCHEESLCDRIPETAQPREVDHFFMLPLEHRDIHSASEKK